MLKNQKKIKKKIQIPLGVVNIQSTFNNTIVTFADKQGNVIASSSSGESGFKGKKKATPYAAQVTVEKASKKAKECGLQTISIIVKGPGMQRESAIRSIFEQKFIVTQVMDVSAIPHNGTRPPKKRRV